LIGSFAEALYRYIDSQ